MTDPSPVTKPESPSNVEIIDVEMARRVLSKLKPGFLPLGIFLEVARLVPISTAEVVPIRKEADGQVSILMTKRDSKDPHWPNMWHTPGSVIRSTDTAGSYKDAFARVLNDELNGIAHIGEPQYFGMDILRDTARGRENAALHYIEVTGETDRGQFFPVDALPEDMLEHQVPMIRQAVEAFRNQS